MLGTSLVLHRLLRREDGGSGGRTVKVPPPPTPAPPPTPHPRSPLAPSLLQVPCPALPGDLCFAHSTLSSLPSHPGPTPSGAHTGWPGRGQGARTGPERGLPQGRGWLPWELGQRLPPPTPVRCRPKDARSAWHAVGAQMARPSALHSPRSRPLLTERTTTPAYGGPRGWGGGPCRGRQSPRVPGARPWALGSFLSLPASPSPLLPSSVPHPGRARARPAGELPAGCCLPRPALAGLDKACLPVDFGFLGAPGPRWGEGPGAGGGARVTA